ncbi:MAG: hypothetical protein KAU62_10005 [Candidatus Heimdallarchaeota archaeon]|nr:hypothetical protein [Candidatus Heimdallarchaeota archaeon]MCK4611476.1 hypothetical protein [Candidatus Heimdallarchaeota archaeon]
MADYINAIIAIIGTLAGVFLAGLFSYIRDFRRLKEDKQKEEKELRSTLLNLVKDYLDSILKIAFTDEKRTIKLFYQKIIIDTEYLDEQLRIKVPIPLPDDPKEDDVIRRFLELSIRCAWTYLNHGELSSSLFENWMLHFRDLCNTISGETNIPYVLDY